ncbi:MAG: hypothetical protein ACRENE_09430 [Polyangiaceae bacterium]
MDLNDSSTFKREAASDLQARRTAVRPALTGDLSALSQTDLLQRGYPPRPDPVKNAQEYADWAQHVATPVDVYSTVAVSRLGRKANTGTLQGTANGNWSGIIQTASGFQNGGLANYGTLYEFYAVNMPAPNAFSCPAGGCNTAIWAGIGGFNTTWIFGSTIQGQLIQSGFNLTGTNVSVPFVEYTPAGIVIPPLPGGDVLSPGDPIAVWGWAAGSSNCNTNNNGAWACFVFENYNQAHQWVFEPLPIQANGGFWIPSTTEYVAEWVSHQNTFYWFDTMQGGGWDSNGNAHLDPGNANGNGDPYVVWTQNGASGPVSVAEWNNGTINTPQDPMWFIWQASQ